MVNRLLYAAPILALFYKRLPAVTRFAIDPLYPMAFDKKILGAAT